MASRTSNVWAWWAVLPQSVPQIFHGLFFLTVSQSFSHHFSNMHRCYHKNSSAKLDWLQETMWNWAFFSKRCASPLLHPVIQHSLARSVGTLHLILWTFSCCMQTFNFLSRSLCVLVISFHLFVAILFSALAESLLIAGFSSEIPDTERHWRTMLILESSWSKKIKKKKHSEILNECWPELQAAARHHSSETDRYYTTVTAAVLVDYSLRTAAFGESAKLPGNGTAGCLNAYTKILPGFLLIFRGRIRAGLQMRIWIKVNLNFDKI